MIIIWGEYKIEAVGVRVFLSKPLPPIRPDDKRHVATTGTTETWRIQGRNI